MYWQLWIDALHSGPECDARREIAGLSDDDVLSFWRWNDRSAAEFIGEAREANDAAALAEIAASLRESLARDVLEEIAYRARKKAGV